MKPSLPPRPGYKRPTNPGGEDRERGPNIQPILPQRAPPPPPPRSSQSKHEVQNNNINLPPPPPRPLLRPSVSNSNSGSFYSVSSSNSETRSRSTSNQSYTSASSSLSESTSNSNSSDHFQPIVPPRPKKTTASSASRNSGHSGSDVDESHPLLIKLRNARGLCELDSNQERLQFDEGYFEAVDEYASNTPVSETKDVKRLARYLTSPFPNDTLLRLRSIFKWIALNISYDVQMFFGGSMNTQNQNASSVLLSRKSVCEGYANLFLDLCKNAMGPPIQCTKITGGSRGVGTGPGDPFIHLDAHAWNAVYIDGEYRFIESTWGAGYLSGSQFIRQFSPFYFLVKPEIFIYSHFPATSTDDQFLSTPPFTPTEWIQLPFSRPEFFTASTTIVSVSGSSVSGMLSSFEFNKDSDTFKLILDVQNGHKPSGNIILPIPLSNTLPSTSSKSHMFLKPLPYSSSLSNWMQSAFGGSPLIVRSVPGARPGFQRFSLLSDFPASGDGLAAIHLTIPDPNHAGRVIMVPMMAMRLKHKGSVRKFRHPAKEYSNAWVSLVEPIYEELPIGKKTVFKVGYIDKRKRMGGVCVVSPSRVLTQMRSVSSSDCDFMLEMNINEGGTWVVAFQEDPGPYNGFTFLAEFKAL